MVFFFVVFSTACSDSEFATVDVSNSNTSSSADERVNNENLLYVYVTGCVKMPGVYTLPKGARVYQAIDMAGGFTKKAKEDSLNLAEMVVDGQQIYVMSKTEYKASVKEEDNLVNINAADKEELMTLPGIGESKAEAIIKYRETNGMYKRIEDVMNVSGIKESAFSQIQSYITV